MTKSPSGRCERCESTAIPKPSRLTTVHPGCSAAGVAAAEGVVVLGVGCVGLGEVVATLLGAAAEEEEDEQAVRASPATPTASKTLIARWRAGRRPRNLAES